MNKFAIFVILLSLSLVDCDDVFSKHDQDRVTQLVKAGDLASDSIDDLHYRVASLNILGETVGSAMCSQKTSAHQKLSALYHDVMVSAFLNCPTVPKDSKSMLQKGLSGDQLVDLFFAVQATTSLIDRGKLRADEMDFSSVVKTLSELRNNDGSYAGKLGRTRASKQNAGLAMQTLATIYWKLPDLREGALEVIENVRTKMSALIALGSHPKRDIEFIDRYGSSLVSTASVLKGIADIASINPEFAHDLISQSEMKSFASFFLKNKFVSNQKAAYYLLASLKILSDNPVYVPIMLTIVNEQALIAGTASTEARRILQVKLTNVFDEFANSGVVTLKKAQTGPRSSPIIANEDLQFSALSDDPTNTHYQANFVSSLPDDGFGVYQCLFSIQSSSEEFAEFEVKNSVKVSSLIDSITFRIYSYLISDGPSSVSENDKLRATYPAVTDLVTLDPSHNVKMVIRCQSDVTPNKIAVLLTHSISGETILFTPETLTVILNVNANEFEEAKSGKYSISVIIGDRNIENSIIWDVATVNVENYEDEVAPVSDEWSIKREIYWTFPSPEDRPSLWMSTIFSGVVLVPFAALLFTMYKIGAFDIHLPKKLFWPALAFQAATLLLVCWFVLYWLYLNIFVAARGLLVLGPLLFISGYYSLKSRAEHRVGHRKTD